MLYTGLLLTLAGIGDIKAPVSCPTVLARANLCVQDTSTPSSSVIYPPSRGRFPLQVDIWGTSELQYFVDAMRTFVPNASFVNTHSFGNESPQSTTDSGSDSLNVLYHDEYVKVSAALLHPLSEPTVNSNNEEGQSCRTIRIAGDSRSITSFFLFG